MVQTTPEYSAGDVKHGCDMVRVRWLNIDAQLTCSGIAGFLDLLGLQGAYDSDRISISAVEPPSRWAALTFFSMRSALAFQSLVHGKVFGQAARACEVVIDGAQGLPQLGGVMVGGVERSLGLDSPSSGQRSQEQEPWPESAPRPSPEPGGPGSTSSNGMESPDLLEWPEGVATVMIRNIACRFTQEDVAEVLNGLGFDGAYDEVCVPRSNTGRSNLGYAFVNFRTAEFAKLCCKTCHGRVFGQSNTSKLCMVVPAHMQGARAAPKRKKKSKDALRDQCARDGPCADPGRHDFAAGA